MGLQTNGGNMAKTTGELQQALKDEGGFHSAKFRGGEWSVVISLPKAKRLFWGFGHDQDAALVDALREFGNWQEAQPK